MFRNFVKRRSSRPARSQGPSRQRLGAARLFGSLEERVLMSTYTVTNLLDHGVGSLRQAVVEANLHAGTDTIKFASSVHGTITLTTGQLTLTGSVNIDGPGAAGLTVSGDDASRAFLVSGGNTSVSISDLTIDKGNAGGNGGGGVLNFGKLTLNGDIITGNVSASTDLGGIAVGGGGLDNMGTANISGCTFQNNASYAHDDTMRDGGGAIYNSGTLSLSNVVLKGNAADTSPSANTNTDTGGGGVFNAGTATLSQTVVSDNSVSGPTQGVSTEAGGGIFNSGTITIKASTLNDNTVRYTALSFAEGCGMYSNGTAKILNSTICYNQSSAGGGVGGGLAVDGGHSTVINCTISQNSQDGGYGGGISLTSGTLTMGNTILANNQDGNNDGSSTAGQTNDFSDVFGNGKLMSLGHNLVGSIGDALTDPWASTDKVGKGNVIIDPGLGALAYNGGLTETMAIKASSPAYNAGSNSIATSFGLTTDQRGFARINHGIVDIGAFEL